VLRQTQTLLVSITVCVLGLWVTSRTRQTVRWRKKEVRLFFQQNILLQHLNTLFIPQRQRRGKPLALVGL